MLKSRVVPMLVVLLTIGVVAGACSSSKSSSSSSAASATTVASGDKTKFCAADAALGKATASATTPADLVTALKAHQSDLDQFNASAPADISTDATALATAAKDAIDSNDGTKLTGSAAAGASGPKVDAYCGLNADGTPTTVGGAASAGDKTVFCGDNVKLDTALAAATDAASAITILKANQGTIHDAVTNAPSDIKANAQILGDAADAAIAANDASKLQSPAVSTAGNAINAYCGLNTTTSTTA